MSKESFASGFVKCARYHGVPVSDLARYILSKQAEGAPTTSPAAGQPDGQAESKSSFWDGVMQGVTSAAAKVKESYDGLSPLGKTLAGMGVGTVLGGTVGSLAGGFYGGRPGRGAVLGALTGALTGGATTTDWSGIMKKIEEAQAKRKEQVAESTAG